MISQPQVIVNNRLGLGETTDDGWDFVTPEQFRVMQWPTVHGVRAPWETCQTFSEVQLERRGATRVTSLPLEIAETSFFVSATLRFCVEYGDAFYTIYTAIICVGLRSGCFRMGYEIDAASRMWDG